MLEQRARTWPQVASLGLVLFKILCLWAYCIGFIQINQNGLDWTLTKHYTQGGLAGFSEGLNAAVTDVEWGHAELEHFSRPASTPCPNPQGCCFDYVRAVICCSLWKGFNQEQQQQQPRHTNGVKNDTRGRSLAHLHRLGNWDGGERGRGTVRDERQTPKREWGSQKRADDWERGRGREMECYQTVFRPVVKVVT